MLGCDQTATLVRRVEEGDGDRYLCTVVRGVSWFAKTSVALSAEGAKPVNTLRVRIPEGALPEDVTPREGDYLARGELDGLEGPEGLVGREWFTVTAVGDDRRGNLRHWSVSGG